MVDLKNNYLGKDDPWSRILAATSFAIRITYHTTLQATPFHMVFGHDMILNTSFITDWESCRISKKN